MNRRVFGWWFFAEAVVARVTTPRTDAATADSGVREAIRGSRLFWSAQTAAGAAGRAWRDAYVRRVGEGVAGAWRASPADGRVRAIGACLVVAAATVLALQTAQSPEAGPWQWILPLAVGIIGAVGVAAARAIARACGERLP